jgi:type IV fimbrial biogenesis protein FimT
MLKPALRGFTLIEMLTAMAMIGVLVAFGAPSLFSYLQNARVRAAATNFYSAAQTARVEAVQRNTNVELVLTTADPIVDNKDTTELAANAGNWMVRAVDPTDPTKYIFIEGKSAPESGAAAQVLGTVDGNASTQRAKVTFNGLSTTQPPTAGAATETLNFDFTNPTAGTCAAAGGAVRCLRVVVSAGGQVRICDPAATADAGDSRRC